MPLARDNTGRSIQALLPRTAYKIVNPTSSQSVGAFDKASGVQIARVLAVQVVGGAIAYRLGTGTVTAVATDHYLDALSGRMVISLQGDGGTEALQEKFACIALSGTPTVYITELY